MGWTGRNDDKRYEEFRVWISDMLQWPLNIKHHSQEFVTQLAKKHLDISKITTEQEDRILLIQKKVIPFFTFSFSVRPHILYV